VLFVVGQDGVCRQVVQLGPCRDGSR
jgi:hypothetical protein